MERRPVEVCPFCLSVDLSCGHQPYVFHVRPGRGHRIKDTTSEYTYHNGHKETRVRYLFRHYVVVTKNWEPRVVSRKRVLRRETWNHKTKRLYKIGKNGVRDITYYGGKLFYEEWVIGSGVAEVGTFLWNGFDSRERPYAAKLARGSKTAEEAAKKIGLPKFIYKMAMRGQAYETRILGSLHIRGWKPEALRYIYDNNMLEYINPHTPVHSGDVKYARRLKVLHDDKDVGWYIVLDTLRMAGDDLDMSRLTPGQIEWYHDAVAKDYARRKMADSIKPFKYTEKARKLETHGFRLPESGAELIDRGNEMGNCVASYAGKVHKGEYILLHFEDMDVGIRNGQIEQAYGPRNQELTDEQRKVLHRWCRYHKIKDPRRLCGR